MPHPERIPVSDADRRGVVDPMSSTINRVGGNGDPVSPLACSRKVAVFDGRVRYDLRSEFKRIEMVKAERGYQGPVVVCAVYFAAYLCATVPSSAVMILDLVALRDAEVWMVLINPPPARRCCSASRCRNAARPGLVRQVYVCSPRWRSRPYPAHQRENQ